MRKIILASASPRRSELMKQAGLDFDVCVSTKEEKKGPWEPEEMVRRLSRQKRRMWLNVMRKTALSLERILLYHVIRRFSGSRRMIRMLSGCFICCRDEPMRCIQVLQ